MMGAESNQVTAVRLRSISSVATGGLLTDRSRRREGEKQNAISEDMAEIYHTHSLTTLTLVSLLGTWNRTEDNGGCREVC